MRPRYLYSPRIEEKEEKHSRGGGEGDGEGEGERRWGGKKKTTRDRETQIEMVRESCIPG